ncbi:prepilin peptidase [Natronospora cellulosivora (SeqCode)]
MLLAIYIFILGLIIGSFLNVVIYRLPRNESIVFPASHCPECKKRLEITDLVPVLSFIFNKAKCKYCGTKISWQYPLVELLTGFLFLLLYVKFGLNSIFIIYSLLIASLLVSSGIDIKYKIIPNKITYPGIIISLILAIFFNHISFLSSLYGIIIPGGLLLIIALIYGKGLGMGDVKLIAMIGGVLGWQHSLFAIFIGSLIGSILGLTLMVTGVMSRKTRIPFGPFISFGAIISIFYGQQIFEWYISLYF